jgi:hypothetical protein
MLLEGKKLSSLNYIAENTFHYHQTHGLLQFCTGRMTASKQAPTR